MDLLFDKLKVILDQELQNINEKIKGSSFLEILKNNILNKIIDILDDNYKNNNKEINQNYIYNYKSRKLIVNLISKNSTRVFFKSEIKNNLLLISINQFIEIDIEDTILKKYRNIKLFPKKAITLPKNTICNMNYPKNALVLEIYDDDIDSDIENIK